MNSKSYKTVFSKRLGCLVAVGEHTTSQGKANGGGCAGGGLVQFVGLLAAGFALVGLAWAQPAVNALPTGGVVAQGAASVSTSGAVMNITQSTPKAVLNWQSFDIGKDAKVHIQQPGVDAVMLNRVTGANPSQIFGQLSANGQVVLVNPNGVLFGKDGSVSASSFTASTLGISDANFMAGNMLFERNGSTAAVVNQGTIRATGGYVALLGASVSNEGRIETNGGAALLGAGETVKVPLGSSGRIKLELSPSAINAAVANSKEGTIVTHGGQVYMQAAALNTAVASIIQSGSIDTTGEQGGAVHLLADGGQIRVDGAITANSTGKDDKGQLRKGGEIVIGRDEETGVLARATDVSGAMLQSKGGFVETSGHHLTMEGVQVIAKDWLLDPDNIDITGDATAATVGYSKIKASDIATALNAGTSVTVSTTVATQVNQPGYTDTAGTGAGTATAGDGNILVNAAIVKSGSNNASLTLLADNGITVNQRIGRAAADTTSNGKLDVVMTANGGVEGTSSKGITLNNVIDANGGVVTLTGTSKDTSGVQTGPTYTYGVTNNSRSGVAFNGGSGITADNYQVTGTHTVAAGNSFGVNGVYINGAVSFKATGNTDSNITGNSNAQGNFGAGVMVWDGASVRLENQGAGITTLKGSNTNTVGGNGIRIGASTNTASIDAIGRVTLGQKAAGVNAPVFVRGVLNASQNTSSLGGLSILGQTGSGLNTSAVQIWDTNINAAGIDVVLDGVANNGNGVYIQTSANSIWTTKNLTVTGVANTTSGSSGAGVVVQRYPVVLTVNASGNIAIEGTVTGAGNGSGLSFAQSGWGPQAPSLTATGNITLRGNNRASTSNTSNAVSIVSGVQVSAGGNIVLQGETNNAAATAISAYSAANAATTWAAAATAGSGSLYGNMSLKSTSGDVLIQSNQGSIVLNNQLTSTLVNGTQTTSTDITGRNITIDNTGAGMATGAGTAVTGTGGTQGATLGSGSIDAATGVITRGAGKSTSSTAGVRMADGRAITAKNNINIFGAGTTGSGVEISGAAALSANVVGYTGNINIAGENTTSSGAAVNISNALSTITALNIATLTSSGTGSGTSLVAAGNITVGGELQVENPVAGTISGVIGGTGMLRKRGGTGAGTLTLTGENTYTGGTTANGGMLQVGNGGTTGTLGVGGAISVGAALSFKRSNTLEISQNISGVGQISQIGTGTTILTGTNSYSGTTTVSSGGLQIGNSGTTGTLGAGAVSVASGANLSFKRSDTWTVANAISGAGNLTQEGSGTTVLTGTNTYTGTTTISAGALQVGNGGTSGTLGTGAVIDNSALIFNRSDSLTVAVAISGSGTLTQAGAGTTILTGTNSYSGTTTISAGALQVGNGGTSGTLGSGAITDNASLVFNRSDSLTIANAISGTGSLTQSGAGTTTLTANNSYLGTTSVSSGTLQIGNGGSTGTLGVGDVTLSNNANLSYVRSASTSIDNKISGAGNVSASITGSSSALSVNKDIDLVNGTVNLAADSDVTLAAKVITTSGSTSAIVLNAGKPSAAGTASGGNILVSGSAAVSAGAGGRATLFTGSVSGSTGLEALIGSGSGRFRYNSDETSTNYTTALGSGLYGIYREKPTLTAAVNNEVKTYDGQSYSGASGSITALTGLVNGDTNAQLGTVSYSASSAKNVGNYTITGTASSGLGYAVTLASGTLTINKANLTLSGSRTYDGTTTFAGQYLTASGVAGETFSVSGAGDSSNLASKHVASNQSIALSSVTGLSLGTSSNGGLSTNYNALSTLGSSVSLTRASATVNGTTTNLTYTGALQSQQAFTSSGIVNGDAVTLSGLASATDAGTYSSNIAVNGNDVNNYNFTFNNANLVIGKANLTLSGTRIYDGSTTFAGQYLTASGVNGETFTVTGSGHSSNLASKNVLDNPAGTVLSSVTGLALGSSSNGGKSSNYNSLSTSGSSVSVTPRSASVNASVTNLTYNGATQNQSAATFTNVIGTDNLTVNGLASGKNAGTYTSSLTAGGTDASNYNFTYNNANLVIGKASLTATANSSVVTYNGVSQSVSGFTVSGLLGSDKVEDLTGISASGASGFNAGSYTSTMMSGAQTNYTVSTINGTLTINKAALTATGNSSSVTYNGFDQSVSGFTVSGLQGTDTINSLSSIQAMGATGKNAGSYTNTVTAGTETNYTVTTVNGTLSIGKAALTATGNSANVTYNGAAQSVSGFTLTGLLGTDTAASITQVSASGASGTHVGSYVNTVTAGTETNYTVTAVNGALTIGKANLTLAGTRVYDAGTSFAGSFLTATGVNGETFTVTGSGDASNLTSKNVQTNQSLSTLTGLALGTSSNGGLSSNYNTLSTTGSSVSVTAKSASVTGTTTNLTYDGTNRTQNAATKSGFITGDDITVSGLATGKSAGTYTSSLAVGGNDAGNYNVTVTNADLVIAQAPLTVTATAVTKTYDGSLGASGTGTVGTLAGAAAGEVIHSAGSQAFLNKDAGTGKTVRTSGVTIKDAGGHDVTGNYAIIYTDNTSSTIGQAALTVTANSDARFVTQSDAVGYNGVSYSGFVGGETASVLGGSLTISRTNAVTDVGAGTYNGVLVPGGLTSSNYNISFVNGSYTIVPANQLLIRTTNASATYGSAPTYSTTAQYLDGNSNLINTLSRTGSNGNYTFSDGAGGSVSVSLKPYSGANQASISTSGNTVVGTYDIRDASPVVNGNNFSGSPVFTGTLSVEAKAVTPSASGVSKTYDGTTSMNNVVVGLSGKVTGDQLSISGTGAFSQKNVGTGLSYTISGVTLSGDDAANYYLSGGTNSFTGNDGVINAASLVISTANVTKVYDRTTSASGTAVAVQGTQLFNGDTFSGGSFAFTNANAGNGNKTVTVSGVTVNDGNGGANYNVSYANNTTSTISPKALTATYSASSKTYDGSNLASVTGASSDVIAGDTVNFSHSTASFGDKHVGAGKTVTVSGIGISGADAANYSLQSTSATTSADISAKALTASFSTTTRAYDGTRVATVVGGSTDLVANDNVSFATTSAQFASADAGTGKLVSISGISLTGTDAGNYSLQNTSASSTGTITRRDVSLSAITGANKTYDGTRTADITGGTINTGVSGESLSVSGSGLFADKHAGNGKQVTVADVTTLTRVDGTGSWSNYNLTTTGSLSTTANIDRAALTVTANAVNKTYDGTLTASGSGTVGPLAGAGDAVSSSGVQNYLDKNAGSGNKVVRASGVVIKDSAQVDTTGNYLITYVDSLTGSIQQAPLEIGVNSITKTYDGTLSASAQAVVRSGTLFSGDSLSGGTFAFTDKNAGQGNKTVTVTGVTVGDGTHNSNYNVSYVNNTTSTIEKAALTVTANGVSKTYDGTLAASGSGTVAGLVTGDVVNSAGSQTYLDANAGTGKTVRALGVTIKDGVNADMTGNYSITYQDVTTGVINKAPLTATLVGSVSKEYDGTTAASNLSSANFSVTGWATAGEGVSVGQTRGTYLSANVADNTGNGSVSAILQASDFTATGNTHLANYTLPTSASGLVGTITQAPLTVKVNNTSMFVTQAPNSAFDNGFAVSGLKNGESAANVLGTLTRSYTGTHLNPAAGTYTGVYDLATTPSPANYSLSVQKGDLTVVPADKLLIHTGSASVTYGTLSASNAGTATSQVLAQYCLNRSDCNGANIASLSMSQQGSRWTATDVSNSTIGFDTNVDTTGRLSAGGYLQVGTYSFGVSNLSTTGTVNFTGSVVNSGVLTVDPKSLTLSASNVSKVYDGTTTLAGMALTPSGVMTGDEISVSSSGGSFNGKNAGSQGFTLTGLQMQGADQANYSLASGSVTGTGTITAKTLTLSASAQDKVYDGTTAASVATLALNGVVQGDAVTASGGSASFADRNVARDAGGNVIAKSVSISGVTLTGTDAGNYTVSGNAAASAKITPLALTAQVTAADKVYDGNQQALVKGSVSGALAGDAVELGTTSGLFESKNVARDANGNTVRQLVVAEGLSLAGADAGNYSLANTRATTTAAITPKTLQATAAVADRMYDGTTQAALTGLQGSGVVTGDVVSVQAEQASFADKNVRRDGSGNVMAQTVTVSGLSISGTDAGNYLLEGRSFVTQARILPRLLGTRTQVADKVYDGSTLASLTDVQLTGLVGQEQLQLSASGSFRSAEIGTRKPVDVRYTLANGSNGGVIGNYELATPAVLLGNILPSSRYNPVAPVITSTTSGPMVTRVVVMGAQAAVAQKVEAENRQECSVSSPEKCDCRPMGSGQEICVGEALPRQNVLGTDRR